MKITNKKLSKNYYISSASLIISFLVLCYALFVLTFIPLKFRLILFLIAVSVTMLVMLLTQKALWRATLAASILIVSAGLVMSQRMINRVVETKDYEIVEYVLITNSNSENNLIKDVGFYGVKFDDTKKALSLYYPELSEKNIEYIDDPEQVLNLLYDQSVDAILVQSSVLSDVEFFDDNFAMKTKTINTFTMKEPRQVITKPVDVSKDSFIVYLSGMDAYGDDVMRSRTDMNVLAVVNPKTEKILLVSIPRDTYVPLACEGDAYDKLTHTGIYGVECSVKTIENFFNIDINYYIRLNFTGFVDIVDELGGVDVNSLYEFKTETNHSFVKGINHVDGAAALAFARERVNIDYGDVSRGKHHQELVKAIMTELFSSENMNRLPQISAYLQNAVDTNIPSDDFMSYISTEISNASSWKFEELNLDGTGDMKIVHSLSDKYKYYVYIANNDSINTIKDSINAVMQEEVSDE